VANPQNCLAMLNIDKQQLRRGGINAAYAQVVNTGAIDAACRLLPKVIQAFLDRIIDEATLPGLDSVNPDRLAEKLHSQLSAIPSLSDPGLTPEEQDNRLSVLQCLRAGVSTDLAREVAVRAEAVVSDPLNCLRQALQAAYATAPGPIREVAQSLRVALDRLRPTETNWKPLTRWQELKRIADKLRQRRGVLPPPTLRTLQESLTGEVRTLHEQTLRTLATEKTLSAWHAAKAEFIQFLDALGKRAAEVVHALAEVKKCLESIRTAVAANERVSRASVVKPIPGPTEDQVIAGMLAQLHATDETALARAVLDRFEARLREICPQVCAWIDRDEPLPDLVRGIPPEAQAAAFRAAVEQAQGPGQSFYELLAREGIDECADFLYRRSEPTVNLSGRDMERLGISPTRLCIVTLPQPLGPKDHQIQSDLRAAFERIDSTCAISDAPATDRTVTVVRLVVGWPIGIEGQNHSLLAHYQRCGKHGHRPHLFGILPESPYGEVIDAYKSLNSFTTHMAKETDRAAKNHA
jgi:hypothetical protein